MKTGRGFQSDIAIVTGAGSGIGRALATQLARAGATVVVADIAAKDAEATAASINALRTDGGGAASVCVVDVSDAAAVAAMVRDVVARHGRIDLLFNNAGISITREVRDLTLAEWRRVIEVNLFGVIHGIHATYPIMVAQGHGHIVNTGSVYGYVPAPLNVPYAATKHAIIGLSESLRAEAAALGVNVSVACPGFVATPIHDVPLADFDRAKLPRIPLASITADVAARHILRGVQANQAVIAFPAHTLAIRGLHRVAPGVMQWFSRRFMHAARAAKRPT